MLRKLYSFIHLHSHKNLSNTFCFANKWSRYHWNEVRIKSKLTIKYLRNKIKIVATKNVSKKLYYCYISLPQLVQGGNRWWKGLITCWNTEIYVMCWKTSNQLTLKINCKRLYLKVFSLLQIDKLMPTVSGAILYHSIIF